MFSILVVDDEALIRKGILSILRRELGESVALYEADNGLSAWEICKKDTPHLIVSDIRMPFCDGLAFVQKMRDNKHTAEIILLTGYEDFSYAQRAISLGVREYVLKPINKADFLSIVKKQIESIVAKQEQQRSETAQVVENKSMADTLRRQLLGELLHSNEEETTRELIKQLEKSGIVFLSPTCQCLILDCCISHQNQDYVGIAVQNIAEEIFQQRCPASMQRIFLAEDAGRTVCIFSANDTEQMIRQSRYMLETVGLAVQKTLNILVYIGVGKVVASPGMLFESYSQANLASLCKIYKNRPIVSEYTGVPRCAPRGKALAVADGICCQMQQETTTFMPQHFGSQPLSLESLEQLQHWYVQMTEGLGAQKALPRLSQLWSITQLHQVIRTVQCAVQPPPEQSANPKLLDSIVAYAKENATKDISLNRLADHFHMTAGYISTLFKKATGSGFADYITQQRIELARKLLITSAIPVYQVAELCGYPNAKYFSVVFKKQTGESPAEYRARYA